MIGIIFNQEKLNRIANQKEAHENIPFYYQLAEKNDVNLFFYSMRGLFQHKRKIKGLLYSYKERKLTKQKVEVPKVNILRTNVKSKNIYRQLKRLEEKYNTTFINMISERNKYEIYQYLYSIEKLKKHIPDTAPLTYRNLTQFIEKYNVVIIKPINGARGEKIFKLEKEKSHYNIHYTWRKKQRKKVIDSKQLSSFMRKHIKVPSFYLVQRWISFREYEGDKFDVRISVQKDRECVWKITGMVARAAAKNGIVTNIAQGGRAVSFKKLYPILKEEIVQKVKELSLDIAEALEKKYPSTADLGLDIAVDQDDQLWFIEANYCDERYSYCESMDLDMWQASYTTPFEYAYAEYSKS